MATLALAVAGAAAGSAFLPAGISVLGTTIAGSVVGSQLGALAGSAIDGALFAPSGQARPFAGPRLSDLKITASTEGASIPRLYGRARLGGQIIWARPLEEIASSSKAAGESKGGGSNGGAARTDFSYFATFAIALCEGEINGLARVWANGAELDLAKFVHRLYRGTHDQIMDPLISAIEGPGSTPAYRNVAYIVFERMALAEFGNRIPQLSFEVHRSVDGLDGRVRGVVLIPGSGEFAYSPDAVTRSVGAASSQPENVHSLSGTSDWQTSIDQLQATLPNARTASLVVSWFGSDLRASSCLVRPAVDTLVKETSPLEWSVGGLVRGNAPVVSLHDGLAAYGGTPSDQTVIGAIRDLKNRGFSVLLTPFVLMDIADGNDLPDPYTGAGRQPAYPWRGRITVNPASGQPGTVDGTASAADQITAFIGTAAPAHFSIAGESIVYAGPPEWSYRRMILHYASLAVAAGGVDAFVIGSELRGLTQARSAPSQYPFVQALAALAADVKSIVGAATKVTYAADWSEYFGHRPLAGSNDFDFHLDPLWSCPAIDAISIDCYWPLADWREGELHLDRASGATSIYDLGYLSRNARGGEGFEWYYATAADRDLQVRTPIVDEVGKPWVFRFKDLAGWWSSLHYNRSGGIEAAGPTAWSPQSKPIWFTEVGCPAVDRGANQPNVFIDPKSSESLLPYYSRGTRDDLMQRRYIDAMLGAFDPGSEHYIAGSNPTSTIYDGLMLDPAHMFVYAWDARPYPSFPANSDVWGDAPNWRLGHWLSGRMAAQPLSAVVRTILEDYGFDDYDVGELEDTVSGYVVDGLMSAREALHPLELAFFLDSIESEGCIRFRRRGSGPVSAELTVDDLVEIKPGAGLIQVARGQETELPAAVRLIYSSLENDYRQAVAQSRRLVGASGRDAKAEVAIVMEGEQASATVDRWLFETWAARERATFSLPPSRLALEPGDLVKVTLDSSSRLFRITSIGEHGARDIEALSIDPGIYGGAIGVARSPSQPALPNAGPALSVFLDLPVLTGTRNPAGSYVATARMPWPSGGVAFYRSPATSGFALAAIASRPSVIGRTSTDLPPGPEGRIDHEGRVTVKLDSGAVFSTTRLEFLNGVNAAAVQTPGGEWEVMQFERADLIAPGSYELSSLLRGQLGTEAAARNPVPAGARFVLLDDTLTPVPLSGDELGLVYNWRYGPASLDIGDPSYRSAVHAFAGTALVPFSPVHIRSFRSEGGIAVSWIRRTRIGGDSWLAPDVPLSEESEKYEIEILDGLAVKRTVACTEASLTYSAADQIADFGSVQSSVTVRIYQIGALGRGHPRLSTI